MMVKRCLPSSGLEGASWSFPIVISWMTVAFNGLEHRQNLGIHQKVWWYSGYLMEVVV